MNAPCAFGRWAIRLSAFTLIGPARARYALPLGLRSPQCHASAVKPLPPADRPHLQAAEGWVDLGNHVEANAELEKVAPANHAHPDVLQVRWRVYAKAGKWDACLDIATPPTRLSQQRSDGPPVYRAVTETGLEIGPSVPSRIAPTWYW